MANAGAAVGGLALLSLLALRNCDTVIKQSDETIPMGGRVGRENVSTISNHDEWWSNPGTVRGVDDIDVTETHRPLDIPIETPPKIQPSESALEERVYGDYAVVKGIVMSEDAARLRNRGVKFICNESFQDNYIGITDYKIIFIYSDNTATLKTLYDANDQQVQDIRRYAASVENNDLVKKVGTREELNAELQRCADQGVKPVLIFHNRSNTLFDAPIETYGVKDLITCNSYQIPETSFSSLDFINLEYVLSSVSRGTAQVSNLAEFYRIFSSSYSDLLQRDNNMKVVVIASVIGGTTGGVGLIVYYNKD